MSRPSASGIEYWLKQVGLASYGRVFVEHGITLEMLPELTESDIDRLALPTEPRRTLQFALTVIRAATHARQLDPSTSAHQIRTGNSYDAERCQLTIMFCDLKGSTELSERLDPEELRALIRAFRKVCREVVERYEGHVAQRPGDAMVAYFGWPIAHEDDAERSARSALEILHAVKAVPAHPPLAVRIGVATGAVVIGGVSRSEDDEARLAFGVTPNLAARLQELAGPDEVVVAPSTRRLVGDAFLLSDMGLHTLKGMSEPVRAWRVHGVRRSVGRFEAARGGVALSPLVGRQEELKLLKRYWTQAYTGEGRVVLVSGVAGVGKSRLTYALREEIEAESHTTLSYQCSPYHANTPLYPIIQQLEFAAGFTREDTLEHKLDKMEAVLVGNSGRRAETAPLFAALLSLPTGRYSSRSLTPQQQKEKTLEALFNQIEALSERSPVLIVLEDCHWIDPTSMEALNAWVPRVQKLPILLLLTYRPESAFRPCWTELSHVVSLSLDRLGRAQTAEFIAAVAGDRLLPSEVVERIAARAEGVPLYAEELTKSVLELGLPSLGGDRYNPQQALSSLAIPEQLRDSLLARLNRRAPEKHVLQIAACIGREFSYKLLAQVVTVGERQLQQSLKKLTELGLVYKRATSPDPIYTFKHALVLDAAYDSLLKVSKQDLHSHLAKVLEDDFAAQCVSKPELLAYHLTQARNPAAAISKWREAGEMALHRAAFYEAVAHFQSGLSLITDLPPSTERDRLELSIREPLNGALIASRGWSATDVDMNGKAILHLAEKQGTSESLLMGLYGVWISTLTQGRAAEALEYAERLLAEGQKSGNIDLRVLGHTAAMISHFYLGQLLAAREHGVRGDSLYDSQRANRWIELTGHDTRTVFLGWSAHWTWMLGYPDQAVRLSNEKDAHARRLGHALDIGYALTVGAYLFDYRCEPENLMERVEEAYRVARDRDIRILYQATIPQAEGLARLRSGQLSESIFLLDQGIETWRKLGGHTRLPYLNSALAEAFALQGDLEAALAKIDEALEQIGRPGWQERSHLAEVLRLKGWILSRQGRDDEAETVLRASIDWSRVQQAKSWELRSSITLARLMLKRGRRRAAHKMLAPIYGWFTEGFDTKDLIEARALLAELAG